MPSVTGAPLPPPPPPKNTDTVAVQMMIIPEKHFRHSTALPPPPRAKEFFAGSWSLYAGPAAVCTPVPQTCGAPGSRSIAVGALRSVCAMTLAQQMLRPSVRLHCEWWFLRDGAICSGCAEGTPVALSPCRLSRACRACVCVFCVFQSPSIVCLTHVTASHCHSPQQRKSTDHSIVKHDAC